MTEPTADSGAARPLAWLALSLGAIVSCLVAGWHAYAWARVAPRDTIPGFLALVTFVVAIDSLAKARAGIRVSSAGPFGLRLVGAGLLTVFSIVLLVLQVRTFGLAFNVRFMIDALFLSIGLVFLGQALVSEKP